MPCADPRVSELETILVERRRARHAVSEAKAQAEYDRALEALEAVEARLKQLTRA